MLGKLLKYELRATGAAGSAALRSHGPLRRALPPAGRAAHHPSVAPAGRGAGKHRHFLFHPVLFACCVASNIVLVVRYYRNLYGDEGYLMNTMPVTPAQNIWAKLISAFLWEMAVALSVFVSLILLLAGTPCSPPSGASWAGYCPW